MDKKCYYPDGGEIPASEDHVPCDPSSTGHSTCCRSDAVCLTNGLCYQQDSWGNRLGRCGCTDSSWQDSRCADVCTDGWSLLHGRITHTVPTANETQCTRKRACPSFLQRLSPPMEAFAAVEFTTVPHAPRLRTALTNQSFYQEVLRCSRTPVRR